MNLRTLNWPQVAVAWVGGLALTAAIIVVARFEIKRTFDAVMHELETAGREHGVSWPIADPMSEARVQAVQSFHLAADSPEVARIARAERRLKIAESFLLRATVAVPLALVALTAYWMWLRRAS